MSAAEVIVKLEGGKNWTESYIARRNANKILCCSAVRKDLELILGGGGNNRIRKSNKNSRYTVNGRMLRNVDKQG